LLKKAMILDARMRLYPGIDIDGIGLYFQDGFADVFRRKAAG